MLHSRQPLGLPGTSSTQPNPPLRQAATWTRKPWPVCKFGFPGMARAEVVHCVVQMASVGRAGRGERGEGARGGEGGRAGPLGGLVGGGERP